MRVHPRIIATALGLVVLASATAAMAQSGVPSEGDISRSLMPKSRGLPKLGDLPPVPANPAIAPAATGVVRMRAPARHPTRVATQPANAHPSATLRTIQFQFGSAELTPDSIETLKNLGNALNHELADQQHFVIEGHTDSYGEAGLNEKLSTSRAEAVKDYLVKQMGVTEGRLQAIGKGSADPVPGSSPYSGINRRVVVVNLEG